MVIVSEHTSVVTLKSLQRRNSWQYREGEKEKKKKKEEEEIEGRGYKEKNETKGLKKKEEGRKVEALLGR